MDNLQLNGDFVERSRMNLRLPEKSSTWNFSIKGNLDIEGDLSCKGKMTIGNCTYEEDKAMLIEQNRVLENRVKELEQKIEMLWYAPGMPGFMKCEYNFFDLDNSTESTEQSA